MFACLAAVAIAWLGLYIHNVTEFPQLSLKSPENSISTGAWILLFLIWSVLPQNRWPSALLLGWGLISLAGAIITVLPLPILPFTPKQSFSHYAVHVVYATTQIPIIYLMLRKLKSGSQGDT